MDASRSDALDLRVDADAPDVSGPFDAGFDSSGDVGSGGCRCEGDRLVGCSPCDDGQHFYCFDGELETGPSCVNDATVATCDGDVEVLGGCAAGCANTSGWGCDFRPSFLPSGDEVGLPVEGEELVVDTDRGRVTIDRRSFDGKVVSTDSSLILYVSTLDVANVVVEGEAGLAIRASDTIRIREGVDVAARGDTPGPGGFEMGEPRNLGCGPGGGGGGPGGGGAASSGVLGSGGGGGGGYGTPGGEGGASFSCSAYHRGGRVSAPTLTGGSAGGGTDDAPGGGGGGAIYLSARVAVFADGVIDASGGGGGGEDGFGGGGGGSGGLIYIETPIFVSSGLTLLASGGGGGGGGRPGSDVEDGLDGGMVTAVGGDGPARGGSGSDEDGESLDGERADNDGGGGGGGGAGWIVVRVGDGGVVDEVQTRPRLGSPSVQWTLLR